MNWPEDLLDVASSGRERLLVALFMRTRLEGDSHPGIQPLLNLVRDAGFAVPRNPGRDLGALCDAGFVDKAAHAAAYRLLKEGERRVLEIADGAGIGWPRDALPLASTQASRIPMESVTDETVRAYLEECQKCLRIGANRAGMVLAWLGAMATVYTAIEAMGFAKFNASAREVRHLGKIRKIEARGHFQYIGDEQVLFVGERMDLFTKTTRQRLLNALNLRHACAHPTGSVPPNSAIHGAIAELVEYVYERLG